VDAVIVNGTPIIANGKPRTDLPSRLPGRALQFKR
jgi:hypothetical protein